MMGIPCNGPLDLPAASSLSSSAAIAGHQDYNDDRIELRTVFINRIDPAKITFNDLRYGKFAVL